MHECRHLVYPDPLAVSSTRLESTGKPEGGKSRAEADPHLVRGVCPVRRHQPRHVGCSRGTGAGLIGHRLMVRQYAQHIECWLGGQCVLQRARATHRDGQRHPRHIDYRHLVAALKRKPGAFARWVLRDAVFPRAVYRQTWERLAAARPEREACRTIVGLLALAADGHEAQLADELEQLIELDQLPDLEALSALLAPPRRELPEVAVELPTLADYDALIEPAAVVVR